MKKYIPYAALLASLAVAPSAFAQTCAAPGGPINAAGSFNATCTTADEFNSICAGSVTAVGTSAVYRVNVGNPNSFAVTVTPSGAYDHAIFLIGPNSCAQTTPCVADNDAAGAGAPESITIPANIPSGTYYLVIDSTAAAVGCVPSTIAVTGTVPVSLKNFSVE
ncbi:MAG: hypothetical protein J0L88_03970 [Xanthomonadales bacterium]|nr:hypothetical protein [Xanthomonadales bacterium]